MAAWRIVADQLGKPSGMAGGIAAALWNRRNAALNETALALLALQPTDRVLDVGFGGGYLLQRMMAVVTAGRLAGVDISPAMVAGAQRRFRQQVAAGRLDLRCAAVEALPFPDGSFTRVSSVNSLFYWQDVAQGLREIKRVLVAGGVLVLCFTCRESLEGKRFARHLQLPDVEDLQSTMQAIGYRAITVRSFSDRHRMYYGLVATAEPVEEADHGG